MHRRQFLAASAASIAVPLLRAAASQSKYSARAIDLVLQSKVIDMLGLLTLNWSLLARWQSAAEHFGAAEFARLRSSGIDVFHPAVAFDGNDTYDTTRDWFAKWNRFIEQHPDYFARIDKAADLQEATKQGKIGIILGMQDANHLRSVDDVDAFHAMGQRLTQVTYNSANRLGAGCMAGRDNGLTAFGGDVVARMNSIGMAIDVSHTGERTTLDVIAASKMPVLITHSNCRALAPPVARCKSDEVIKAAANKGGVIGLTNVRHFVRAHDPVGIEDVLDHFDHAVQIAGIEHVGIGSDLDLDGRDRGAATLRYDIAGLNKPARIYELTEGLIRRKYTDEQITLMLGGNFTRALTKIWS